MTETMLSAGVTLGEALVLDSRRLLPAAWSPEGPPLNLRIFNPALVLFQQNLIMTYRVDFGRGASAARRMAVCRLDEQLRIVPSSVLPLSDQVEGAGPRHYDPRFLIFGQRLFVHFNNNYQTRPNQIYLVELDADKLTAKSAARPLRLQGARQEIEKNWMLFEHEGELLAVYRIAPHTILRLDLDGDREVICREAYRREWNVAAYADLFGIPCGGTPPARHDRFYISFFHSSRPASRWHRLLRYWPLGPNRRLPRYLAGIERRLRRPLAQRNYYAGFYAFEAVPPFRPVMISPEPVLRPENEATRKLKPQIHPLEKNVVYPGGAVLQADGSWLVSYGRHDECCCLRHIRLEFK